MMFVDDADDDIVGGGVWPAPDGAADPLSAAGWRAGDFVNGLGLMGMLPPSGQYFNPADSGVDMPPPTGGVGMQAAPPTTPPASDPAQPAPAAQTASPKGQASAGSRHRLASGRGGLGLEDQGLGHAQPLSMPQSRPMHSSQHIPDVIPILRTAAPAPGAGQNWNNVSPGHAYVHAMVIKGLTANRRPSS